MKLLPNRAIKAKITGIWVYLQVHQIAKSQFAKGKAKKIFPTFD